ncbi:MAG TPA: carbon storage regulator CsrA [Spirochaetia bacterium]|nr:carbon storage regulator CsrA [Spirochaetia bacterium]
MLILARKTNEKIMIGDQIEIAIIDIKGDQVKIGINAPKEIKVYRQEVYRAIQQENIEASKAKPEILPQLDSMIPKRKKENP